MLQRYPHNGSGQQLAAYRPKNVEMKVDFLYWMTTIIGWTEATKANDRATWFAFQQWLNYQRVQNFYQNNQVQTDFGEATWNWPEWPPFKSKPMFIPRFDGSVELFNRGAHIPLIVWAGDAKDSGRSQGSTRRRDGRAGLRGRGWSKKQREERAWQQWYAQQHPGYPVWDYQWWEEQW